MILALTVAVLVTGGVYLLLQRSMVRAVFGMTLISHAANFALLATGVPGWRAEPLTEVPVVNNSGPSPPGWCTCVETRLARRLASSPAQSTTAGEFRCWVRAKCASALRCHSASPALPSCRLRGNATTASSVNRVRAHASSSFSVSNARR